MVSVRTKDRTLYRRLWIARNVFALTACVGIVLIFADLPGNLSVFVVGGVGFFGCAVTMAGVRHRDKSTH